MKIAVIGYGHWGPNLVNNFAAIDDIEISYVCDLNNDNLREIKKRHHKTQTITDYNQALDDDEVSAVVIATPVCNHYEIAKKAMLKGKHVLVEKPLSKTVEEAKELIKIAKEKNLVLMVDHISVYIGAVEQLKELIHSGELGNILYFSSIRINLGLFQKDVNVVWDLAPHDLSVLKYILPQKPIAVSAVGASHLGNLENIAYINLFYEDKTLAHCHVNWLAPEKIRTIVIGGDNKMVVYNDLIENKLIIYDKGVALSKDKKNIINYKQGKGIVLEVDKSNPLEKVCLHFLDCIRNNKEPITGGEYGLDIVKVIVAAQKSINSKGKAVEIE